MPELKPILLVEDNPKDLELTLAALEQSQLANEVVIVRDGAEALDFLYRRGAYESRNTSDPAVVLLDLKLPKIDGLEVLEKVKSDPHLRQTPVVMLTSSRSSRACRRPILAESEAIVVALSIWVLSPMLSAHFSVVPIALNTAKNTKITNRNSAIGLT